MFKNYLIVAIRSILRNKIFSLINIMGLAIGLTCSFLILLWVLYEVSFDRFHENTNEIHKVLIGASDAGPGPLANTLKENYPEIVNSTRSWKTWNESPVMHNNNVIFGIGYGVEQSFFEIFSFPFVSGNPETALSGNNFIILSEDLANKLFNEENPIGQTIQFDWWSTWYNFEVTAIVKNAPDNSSFKYDYFLPFNFVERSGWDLHSWKVRAVETYVLLQQNLNVPEVNEKIAGLIKENDPGSESELRLKPLKEIHLYNNSGGGPIIYIYIFSSIGLMILIIACINYMNLTTARAASRSKEIGIRKVIGSNRRQLIYQFLGESVILSVIAFNFAIIIIILIIPFVNNLLGVQLRLNYSEGVFWIFLFISVFTGILSGCYPAFILSKFKPIKAITGSGFKYSSKGGKNRSDFFRKFLVVTQFFISIVLIICAIVAYKQLNFIKNKDLGFDKEYIIHLKLRGSFNDNYHLIKQDLLKNPDINSITITNGGFANNSNGTVIDSWEEKNTDENIFMCIQSVDFDYLNTFNVTMTEGRFFSEEFASDSSAVILNEAAIKAIKMENPVEKKITWRFVDYEFPSTIIGVVKDYNIVSLHENIVPVILVIAPWWYSSVYIKIKPDNADIQETITYIKDIVAKNAPDYPFDFSFVDDEINNLYKAEQQAELIVKYGTVLAIFIACLGLFGLAVYSAQQRNKEIGIRKVNGASVTTISLMLAKDFTKWILLANIFAWPVAWFIMNKWLRNFAFKTDQGIWIFILAGTTILIIALLTVFYQAFKAANTNPADVLRDE